MLFLSIITAVAVLGGSGLLPLSAALDGGFKDNCNIYSAQLIGQDLGMYCNNDNTAMFGYNWTWCASTLPCLRTSPSDPGGTDTYARQDLSRQLPREQWWSSLHGQEVSPPRRNSSKDGDAYLVDPHSGHFSGSCHNCSIKRDGPEPTPTLNLTCDCKKLDRTLSPSSLDLSTFISILLHEPSQPDAPCRGEGAI